MRLNTQQACDTDKKPRVAPGGGVALNLKRHVSRSEVVRHTSHKCYFLRTSRALRFSRTWALVERLGEVQQWSELRVTRNTSGKLVHDCNLQRRLSSTGDFSRPSTRTARSKKYTGLLLGFLAAGYGDLIVRTLTGIHTRHQLTARSRNHSTAVCSCCISWHATPPG